VTSQLNAWPTSRLGDVLLDARPGFACGEDVDDGVIQFRMNNVTREGGIEWSKVRRVPASYKDLSGLYVEPGDVLFNNTNSADMVGKSAYFAGYSEPVTFSNHFLRLRVRQDAADSRYLHRWLIRQWRAGVFEAMCRKWVNQATVARDQLLDLVLPLPPIAEQRRIADVLDQTETLRKKRLGGLVQLDSLADSLFLDMFGDPVTNPKGWPREAIVRIGKVTTGNTPSRANAAFFGDEIEWVKPDNLATSDYYATRAEESLSAAGKAVARTAPAGAILVTCIAGSPGSIGNAAMLDREVAFNQQINALLIEHGDSHFYYAQVRLAKRLIQAASTGGMKGLVSKSRFEEIQLVVPPVSLQREFAARVSTVEGLRAAQRVSLAELSALFSSAQERAFAGEL
jgi:type I restriction enzyme S subunit